ncbi:MAG: protein-export chaperone SecB [Betaproteobacteria bacterium]|nr:protein-export chaperone SecB [Betaproteobacteria bacterium]
MSEQQPQQPQQPQQAPNAQDTTQPIFAVEKVYVKDMSVEVPGAPKVFLSNETPQVEVNISTAANVVEQGALYEVVLTATITTKTAERTLCLVEVAQAGLFHIRNLPPQDLDAVLGILCPSTLLPYAREAVSSAMSHAGFPPVLLHHMDFSQAYQQAAQQRAAQAGGQAPAQPTVN